MLIHLIRHTRPDIDQGVCYGHTDIPLAESFEQERHRLLQSLLPSYDRVFSSPLKRCRLLADTLSKTPPVLDARLQELNFGDWENRPWHTIATADVSYWSEDYVNRAPPNGESMQHMMNRVAAFWQTLLSQACSTIAVVTHAGVMRLLYTYLTRSPLTTAFDLSLSFGAVIEVTVQPSTDCKIRQIL